MIIDRARTLQTALAPCRRTANCACPLSSCHTTRCSVQGAFGPMGGFGGFMQQAPPPVGEHGVDPTQGMAASQGFDVSMQGYQPQGAQDYNQGVQGYNQEQLPETGGQ